VGLIEAIGAGPVGIDSCVFIYFIERHPTYGPLVRPLFESIDRGSVQGITSSLTLLETQVVPLRDGDRALAHRYEALLSTSRGLSLVELDRPLLSAAALLRATTGVRTPDALQLAAALRAGCTAFVTNDRRLPAPAGVRIVQLRDLA